jgi:hypothetical protein
MSVPSVRKRPWSHASNGTNENLRVDHWPDGDGDATTLARVPMAGLKGIWLEVRETIRIADSGSIQLTIKKPDGSTVIEVNQAASISGDRANTSAASGASIGARASC